MFDIELVLISNSSILADSPEFYKHATCSWSVDKITLGEHSVCYNVQVQAGRTTA